MVYNASTHQIKYNERAPPEILHRSSLFATLTEVDVEIIPLEVHYYVDPAGNIPFSEWLDSFKDKTTLATIYARLGRLRNGLLGDNIWVAPGIFELRIHYGPGYRIYFGRIETTIILLLCGGDKKSQTQDIHLAQDYWLGYLRRRRHE